MLLSCQQYSRLLINFDFHLFQLWHLPSPLAVRAAPVAPAPPTSDLSTISTHHQPGLWTVLTLLTLCRATVRARPPPSGTSTGPTPRHPPLTEAAPARDVTDPVRAPPTSPPPCPPPPRTPAPCRAPALGPAAPTAAVAVRAAAPGDLQTSGVSTINLHRGCHNPRLFLVRIETIMISEL